MTSSPRFLRTAWRRSALETPSTSHVSALAEAGRATPSRLRSAPTTDTNPLGMRQDGQVLIIFAIFSMVLIGVLALSIDAGYLMAQRRQVQNAADAGALAAAHAAMSGQNVVTIGKEYGAFNGDVAANAVTVSRPPTSGARAGNNDFVQVTVSKPVQRFFVGAVYNGDWSVSATAVAGIVPEGTQGCIFAKNPTAGGINTSGNSTLTANGCSIVTNYEIRTGGTSILTATEYINANDGFKTSGYTVIDGGKGENPAAKEVPDPLEGKISPPTLPSGASNPVPSITPSSTGTCRTYNPWTAPVLYSIPPVRYNVSNSNCVNIENIPSGQTFEMQSGSWKFDNGAGINVGGGNVGAKIILRGGTWNFSGSNSGINVGGNTPSFEMRSGDYSFLNGARINFGGSNEGNVLGGGRYYFSGGGGLVAGGSTGVTIGPGTYIFDGGPGFNMGGSDGLHFDPGNYTFYFLNGADFQFTGNSKITFGNNVYVKMYFLGGSNWSDLSMSGYSNFGLPPGEYYFKRGNFFNSGNSSISGENVFLYFTDGGRLESSGSAYFDFTAPTTQIYPGYYPGVFLYSDPSNTATFKWQGTTNATSKGVIYLPSSPLTMSGASGGVGFEGQIIVDRLITSGYTVLTVNYVEYVQMQTNRVFLVQ